MVSYGQGRENKLLPLLLARLVSAQTGNHPQGRRTEDPRERAEARDRGLPAHEVRFQSKQQAVCLSRLWNDGFGVRKGG